MLATSQLNDNIASFIFWELYPLARNTSTPTVGRFCLSDVQLRPCWKTAHST